MRKSKPGRDGNPMVLVPARGHERYGKTEALVRNIREHPMETLLDRGTIEGYHHQAADRFLRDWELSQVSPARASTFEPGVDGGRAGDLTATQADALTRVNRALQDLGRNDRLIVTMLIVGRKNLDEIGASMRGMGLKWPQKRYAGPRLCEALHELALHYGLVTKARRNTP